ncbi:hypothetical protein GCM10023152_05090 [Agromyces bauzanensis]|uniref:Uncharacterized protein n=1 Tax=Agromyces bauzanensis TaxID=1308924 RepID=A0A917PC59_9MICO|nr:hypothetical protein GCM10011372_05480 [Agromyces bauzanensis]
MRMTSTRQPHRWRKRALAVACRETSPIRPARDASVDSGRPPHKGGTQQASGTDPGSLAASDPSTRYVP